MSEYVLVYQHGRHLGQLPHPPTYKFQGRFRQFKVLALALLKLLLR